MIKMKLMLINKDHPLPENYKPCLTDLMEGYQLERKTACAMKEMICAALKDGIHLRIFSAYRSISYQQGLFNEDIQRYMKQGMSYEDAFNKTAQSIAVPGQSEHNAGLAADISTMDWKGEINPEFENTEEFRWLDKNAAKFGFILRYPKGKEHITSITYEPWHYRYVGRVHAERMKRMGLTLEEYLDLQCAKCD
jgi:D-alanyl-D-alanine carboxypeptidase